MDIVIETEIDIDIDIDIVTEIIVDIVMTYKLNRLRHRNIHCCRQT